jgi:hypothetical protein
MLVVAAAACSSGHTTSPDAAPPGFTIYLNFDGVTLQPAMLGGDDAATNRSSIVTAQTVAPPYLQGVATRDTTIASIVTAAKTAVAPFNVAIVTDRPTSLDYFMIVFTGQPSVVFGPGGGNGVSAVTTFPCMQSPAGPANPNSIGFQFQSAPGGDAYGPVARGNLVIPVVALAQNIEPTTTNGDCLCFAAAGCGLGTSACTIGGPGTPVDTAHGCAGAAPTEDEMALLAALFGAAH